ncbi:hypothetical protein Tco_0593088 [Tanacetum coccineum]
MPNTRSGASMTHGEIEDLIAHRVAEEIESRKAAINLEPLNENRDEQEGGMEGNANGGNKGNGENGNGNRNRNHGMKYGGFMLVARECTFQDFLKCKPQNFSGTKGVNLAVKGNDLTAYTQKFQELILLCTRMVPDEEDKVKRNVIATEPIKLQDAIRISNNLMDQKIKGYARSALKTREGWRNNRGNNRSSKLSFSEQNIGARMWQELYTAGNR